MIRCLSKFLIMYLEIVTPDKSIFKGEVGSVTLPGSKGSFQILPGHAPIISSLDLGTLKYSNQEANHQIMISGGIVEVMDDQITVLAESLVEEQQTVQ